MEESKKSGKYIPWIIVAFFAILFCADGFLAYLAVSTHPGIRVNHAYEKGIAYNKTLDEYQKQTKLGLKGNLTFATQNKNIDINFSLKDKNNTPLDDYNISAKISRPTSKGHDQTVKLLNIKDGNYNKNINVPLVGIWDIYIFAEKDGNIFRMTKRLDIE